MKKYGLLFLCLLALPVSAKTVNSRYTPVKNPNPRYFLTITGHVMEKSRKVFTLIAVYETSNPDCNEVVNRFEGVSGPRDRRIQYRMDLSRKNFILKIPLQYFLSGYCQWKLMDIEHGKNPYQYRGARTLFAVEDQSTIANQDRNISLKYQKNDWYQIHPKYLPVVVLYKNNYFNLTFSPMEQTR